MAKADDRDPSFLVKSEVIIAYSSCTDSMIEGRELLKEAITCEKVQGYRKARDLYLEASDKYVCMYVFVMTYQQQVH